MFSYSANVTPVTSIAPARPARAPLARNAWVLARTVSIWPALRAASGFAPVTRILKPAAVNRRNHHVATAPTIANGNPACRREVGASRGSLDAMAIVLDCG